MGITTIDIIAFDLNQRLKLGILAITNIDKIALNCTLILSAT